jgi:hypothetical protein
MRGQSEFLSANIYRKNFKNFKTKGAMSPPLQPPWFCPCMNKRIVGATYNIILFSSFGKEDIYNPKDKYSFNHSTVLD